MKHNAKSVIIDAFKILLNKKCIDKITVKELCQYCNVNRQTFYNHFTDIMDIFKYIFYKELSEEIEQKRSFSNWTEGFLITMNYIKSNSKMILHVYNSSYWNEANRFIVQLSRGLLEDVVDECCEGIGDRLKEADKDFIIKFYVHIFNELIIDWVRGGMLEEPDDILESLLLIIEGSIPSAIKKFTNRRNFHSSRHIQ